MPGSLCWSCLLTGCSLFKICVSLSVDGRQTVWWEQVIIIFHLQQRDRPAVHASLYVGGMLGYDLQASILLNNRWILFIFLWKAGMSIFWISDYTVNLVKEVTFKMILRWYLHRMFLQGYKRTLMWTAAWFYLFWSYPNSCVLGKMSVNVFTKTISYTFSLSYEDCYFTSMFYLSNMNIILSI